MHKNLTKYLERPESSPQATYIQSQIKRQVQTIYLLARGQDFIDFTKKLLEYFEKDPQVARTNRIEFDDYAVKKPAIVGQIRLKGTYT